jgi:hypothetical protein
MYLVVDNDFNRANYPDMIGTTHVNPPSFVNVQKVEEQEKPKERTYGVSVKEPLANGGDRWHNTPTSRENTIQVLIHNGWTAQQAEDGLNALDNETDPYLLVSNSVQIC